MKYFLRFLVACLYSLQCYGAVYTTYSVNNIPPDLLLNANTVVRNSHTDVRIVSLNEIYVTEQYAVTILNEKGYNESKLQLVYDKFRKIKRISGKLYDAEGKQIKKLNTADMQDVPIDAGGAFVDDDRVRFFDFNYAKYPFTVEYEVEQKYSYSFFLPDWQPQDGYKCAVESADINIEYAKDIPLRYRLYHIDSIPDTAINDNTRILKLALNNLQAIKENDRFALHDNYPFPTLILASDDFQIEDQKGSMASWTSLGKFVYDLNANRDELPAEIKATVHQLTDTCHNNKEKIRLLYSYLQKNTRYVGIQLGIGGWQTFDANFVGAKGYGDCKALSNYMHALLKEAGITSYQALVNAGENNSIRMDLDFPHPQFNHVILCVPAPKDTTWLECTSNVLPAGYLSDFTSDRNVLLLTPDGGHVIHTPIYGNTENIITRNATAYIDSNDVLHAHAIFNYQGAFYNGEKYTVLDQTKDKVTYHLNSKFSLPNSKIDNYQVDEGTVGCIPFIKEKIEMEGAPNINRSGKRLFIATDIIMHNTVTLPDEKRTKPFEVSRSYQVNDTLLIKLDGKYNAESIPSEVTMNYPFADYNSKITFENGSIKIARHYSQHKGIYPASMFADYAAIIKMMNNSTAQHKVVLVATN